MCKIEVIKIYIIKYSYLTKIDDWVETVKFCEFVAPVNDYCLFNELTITAMNKKHTVKSQNKQDYQI